MLFLTVYLCIHDVVGLKMFKDSFKNKCVFQTVPKRWCKEVCTIHPDTVEIPQIITNDAGDEIELMVDTAVIWPWDFFAYLWEAGKFLQWVSDDPNQASQTASLYWTKCQHLEFFNKIGLPRERFGSCIPVQFHTDGVKIYKNQKAWVYSISAATRKGSSMKTKLAFILVRETCVVKQKTHDSIGRLVGYMVDTLMTGKFPTRDHRGQAFPPGSRAAERAGQEFAGGWSMAFWAFKGDWDREARVIVHKHNRYYRSTWICEHCLASYRDDFTFADFRTDANSQSVRFTHDQYLALTNDKSAWTSVKGWTKDRNLEEPLVYAFQFFFNMSTLLT